MKKVPASLLGPTKNHGHHVLSFINSQSTRTSALVQQGLVNVELNSNQRPKIEDIIPNKYILKSDVQNPKILKFTKPCLIMRYSSLLIVNLGGI